MVPEPDSTPIGVFDSGVGGLSVFKAIRQRLPSQPVIYLADQAHVPYGYRSLEEVALVCAADHPIPAGSGRRLIVWPVTRLRRRRAAFAAQGFSDRCLSGHAEPA